MAVIETMNRRTLCNLLDLFESDGLAVTAFRREPPRDLPTEEPSRFAFLTCSITQSGHFFFGLAGRTTEKLSDEETLYVPCILHDLGLTEQFRGDPPVEIHGVESAKKFSSEQGYSRDRTETAGTELPFTPRHRRIQRLEIALVGQGAGADV